LLPALHDGRGAAFDMAYEKKHLIKPDGRYLVLYHFADTATPDQSEAFRSAEASMAAASAEQGARIAKDSRTPQGAASR